MIYLILHDVMPVVIYNVIEEVTQVECTFVLGKRRASVNLHFEM
jgi:hypothetical protein